MTKTESRMDEGRELQLETPRFESGKPLLMAGLRGHFTAANREGIPALWQRLATYGKVPGQVEPVHYGLYFNMSDGIDYLAGAEVASDADLPGEFSRVNIPAQRYVVFPHREHVSKLYNTVDTIWRKWFPGSGHEIAPAVAGAPNFFERYGEGFDPRAGMGDIAVWIPIKY